MLTGRIDIQYRRVQCTPPSNLIVNIDQNSGTGGFLKMSVTVSHTLSRCYCLHDPTLTFTALWLMISVLNMFHLIAVKLYLLKFAVTVSPVLKC